MRRNRNQTELPMDRPVARALDDEEITERSKRLCELRAAVRGLKRDIRDSTKSKQDEIAACEATMLELETQIVEGLEMRKQGDLFVDKKALASVAAAAGEPKPTDPHPFQGTKGKPFECVTCGSSPTDPVHPVQAENTPPAPGNGKAAPDSASVPGAVSPAKSVAIAKARVVGKGPLGRAKKRGREART